MANKRYYWLKLYDDFFSSLRIKKLRKLAGGDTYLAIYLKMQLLAMKSDGILKWSGLEDDFTSELALELDEEPENIKVTLAYLLSCGLAETDDSINYFFPFAVNSSGTCTPSSWGRPSASSTAVLVATSILLTGSVPVVGSQNPHFADFSSV